MSRKAKKAITAEEQFQMDVQLEGDLVRLVKQAKYYERERGTYTSGAKLAKQEKSIRILEKEENEILTDLYVATCSTKKKEDACLNANMMGLLHESDFFDEQLKDRKAHLQEIADQIVVAKKKVIEVRTKVIGDVEHASKVLSGQKVLEGLENKLDTAVKRFCIIQTENSKLREEIEHLFLERLNFNKLWGRLISNLDKGKKFMIDIIEQSSIAYNERDEWVSRLNALRTRGHTDLIMHTEEMTRLQHKTDDYGKLGKFLGVKGQKRIMRDLERKEKVKRLQQRDSREARLHECKTILAEILEFSGFNQIDDFCLQFALQEENNLGMMNYINVLHEEMEKLTGNLITLHKDIDAQKNLASERADHQTTNIVKLKEQLKKTTKEANASQALLDETNDQLKKNYVGIKKLFTTVKCTNAPIMELLGDNTTINDYNALLHLDILEERISELILNVYCNQKSHKKEKFQTLIIKESEKAFPVHLMDKIIPTNPCPLCVDQELVACVIDTLQFVQTREEVRVKLAQRMALPDGVNRLHNVSACHLPKSRQIMQRRYQ